MQNSNAVEIAKTLTLNHTKKELAAMARGYGWKGDDARQPILALALYVAAKMVKEADATPEDAHQEKAAPVPSQDDEKPASEAGNQQDAGKDQQQDQQDDAGQSDGKDGNDGDQQQEGDQSDNGPQSDAGEDQQDGNQQQDQQQDQQQQDQQQQDQQDNEPEDEEPQQDENQLNAEFDALLKAANISKPHRLLRKVWLLAAKAKRNVMLIGPAGTGKTMLSQQLAQLMGLPFGSISCTMGMSESQLSGWLLPVGKKGRFDYVPAPFINCIQSPSVFLLDELDGADSNVVLMLNSIMANGFITVPHKLVNPVVSRHPDSIIIAGCNGAGEAYTGRGILDGATLDRFYPVTVDYDMDYIHDIFATGGKAKRRSAKWSIKAPATPEEIERARDWYVALMGKVKKSNSSRIVGTRTAQSLVAAMKVGIPFSEAVLDLFSAWSDDERAQMGI